MAVLRRDVLKIGSAGVATALAGFGGQSFAGVHTGSASIVVDGLDTSLINEGFLDLAKKGGVDCVHKSVTSEENIGALLRFIDAHPEDVALAKSVADIERIKTEGKLSLIMGSQDANWVERLFSKSPFESYERLRNAMRARKELGVTHQGIAYNVSNLFGGGNLDPNVPLTRAGRVLVEQIHLNKMILDVGGHTGEQTSFDAIEISNGAPVVCTHTNMAALNPNPRAISDRLAEMIACTGGVIGLTAISDFIVRNKASLERYPESSPQAKLDQFLDQYDHLKSLVGVDHVALGPDFIWGWAESLPNTNPEDDVIFPSEVMSKGVALTVKDFEDISKLPNVAKALRNRGWTNEELDKLFGLNWLRVYRAVWGT